MSAFFQNPSSLSKKDFSLFYQLFRQEVDLLMPVSSAVFFWEQDGNWLPLEQAGEMLGKRSSKLPALCASLEPAILGNVLILPVELEGSENIAVIVDEIDSGLLQKMAPEWLDELRYSVQHALVKAKQAYIYPETGLYSSRLLKAIWNKFENTNGAFFLIGALERSKHSTSGLVKIMQTSHLLEATMSGPVFYFGGNVFGVLQDNISRDSALHLARRLLGRLKRDGLHNVHIGIALVREQEEKTLDQLLDECWLALETAEQRGPYNLCEASFVYDQLSHPFLQPTREKARKLQNKWRKIERFCLLLVRIEEPSGKDVMKVPPLEQLIPNCFQEKYSFVPVGPAEGFIVLLSVSPEKAMQVAKKIKSSLDDELKVSQVAVGLSYWPCQDFSKTATMINCRKALMHGDFFGPGSITLFDHVSLNVSGDYFFDEGDYRQAVRDYRAGLKINPDDVNLKNSLGVALTELNKLTEARQYFDLVLEKEPKNFMALVNKGFALRMLKQDDGALACFIQAEKCKEFTSSPVSDDISLQLGHLFHAKGEYKKAIRVLEKRRSRDSEKAGYLLYSILGGAYAATGKNKKAISILQQAIKYNPHDARSLSILGELYGVEGQGDDIALALCTQAVNIDDKSWENWYRLAKLKVKMADYEGAQAAIRESMQRNRKAVDAIFLAGKIFVEQGDNKKAKKMFSKVLRVAPGYPGASRALQTVKQLR